MIIMNLELNHIYGFENFKINFTYPKKIIDSLIEEEHLNGRERFRYKKVVILMGANASGKTTLGKALFGIFKYIETGNETFLFEMCSDTSANISMDFVNEGYILHRISIDIDINLKNTIINYQNCEIEKMDSYEKCAAKLVDHTSEAQASPLALSNLVGPIHYRFSYPEVNSSVNTAGIDKQELLKTLRAVIGTLDPTLADVTISKDLENAYIIHRKGKGIIIQDGQILNRDIVSSGTAEGVDAAVFLAAMLSKESAFYYCDEHFSYIQSDIEQKIFALMMQRIGQNSQMIFTTHNTDMLDLNLPKHAYVFLRKKKENDHFKVSAISASEILKRNTDSVRSAVENDVFASIPDDSLLDELDKGW